MRLDKFVCKSTQLTRAQATQAILNGDIEVNQQVITDVSFQVHENNLITHLSQRLTPRASRYIMFHKPSNTLCSNVNDTYPSVFNFIDCDNVDELHIVGRLDVDTTGLVLMTDDGRWSFKIIRPTMKCEKTYRVSLSKPIQDNVVDKFADGIALQGEDKLTMPAKLIILSPREVLLTITEGRYHQVKRMFAAVGNRVVSLHRQSIGNIELDIELGHWRHLTAAEIASF